MIQKLLALFTREPAIGVSLINAVLVVAVTFGLHLAPDQTVAIDALLAILAGIAIRAQVTPVASAQTPAK